MTQLYDKVYNLFHQWLSTEEEDEITFQEWLNSQFIYQNGKVIVNLSNIPQTKATVTIYGDCTQMANNLYKRFIVVEKEQLLPSPVNNNQPIQVKKGNTIISPTSGNYYLYNVLDNPCPNNPSFDVIVTIGEYIEDDICYKGIKYKFTVPSFSSTNGQRINCNVEVIE